MRPLDFIPTNTTNNKDDTSWEIFVYYSQRIYLSENDKGRNLFINGWS